ncbi:MAG: cyanophycinase [Gemmatales bacterium]
MKLLIPATVLGLITAIVAAIAADSYDGPKPLTAEATTPAPVEVEGIGPGTLIIQGGGDTPKEIADAFYNYSGKENSKLVIIPTASGEAEKRDGWSERWMDKTLASFTILHTRDRKRANSEEFVKPLREATAVWIAGGDQQRLSDAYVGTLVEKELQALLKRGGVIWGTSAGAAIQSRLMIAGGKPPVAELSQGFNLLPGAVIDQHFVARKREPRLLGVLQKYPGFVGFGVDEATALVVKGRTLRVIGKSTVTVIIPEGAGRPLRRMEFKDRQGTDFTMLRKSALGRTETPYPPKKVANPEVPKGSLLIVGGGGMPQEVVNKYIELAGGKDKTFIVLPTSNPDPIPANSGAFLKLRRHHQPPCIAWPH